MIGFAEDDAVLGVGERRFVGGLHDPDGARGRLESPVLEAGHLEVEAPTESVLAADEVVVGHEPVVEGQFVGVHAAIADRVDRATLEATLAVARTDVRALDEDEAVALGPGLLDEEERQSAVRRAAVGVGAREQHQDVGARRERAPGLRAVDQPAAVGLRRARGDAGDVTAEVRFGDGDGGQDLARRQSREPPLLLLAGAALHERARQDLRTGDQRAADAEGAPGEFLGRHDHAQVLRLAARGEAAELLGHRETEAAELGESRDHRLGDVGVGAVDVFGVRANLLERRSGGTCRRPSRSPRRGGGAPALSARPATNCGVAVGGDERRERSVPVGVDRPRAPRARGRAWRGRSGRGRGTPPRGVDSTSPLAA